MSRTFKISVETGAFATVTVALSDRRLASVAEDLGKAVNDLTIEDLTEVILETFEPPTICAQCGGWGRNYGLELGDEWVASVYPPGAPAHTAVHEGAISDDDDGSD